MPFHRTRRWRLPPHPCRSAVTLLGQISAAMLAFMLSQPSMAQQRAVELPASDRLEINDFTLHVGLLEDSAGDLDIRAVSSLQSAQRFAPATAETANVGFTDASYWVRFTLRNPSASGRQIYVRQTYPLIDYLDVFQRMPQGWQQVATGDRRPFDTRPVAHRDLIFPLTLPALGEGTFYMRYQSQGPIDINLSLYAAPDLMEALSREQTAYGIYYGAVVMLLVWAGLVFIAVRDKVFIAYFAYVSSFGLYMLVHNGLAYQYLWPNSPRWGNTGLIVLLNVALFAALQFSRMILRAREHIPRLDHIACGLQVLAVVGVLATPVLSYSQLIAPVTGLILVAVIFMLTMGIASALAGSRPARYYVLAWGSFLAGSIVFLLKTFGVLPHTFFTQNGWQIGSLAEMILLSLTLSSRMSELQQQSRTDPLTLLGNRRLFNDRLATDFSLARHLRRPLSLLVMDIDHFKDYNDRFGHTQGDEAIRVVAETLRNQLRKPSTACRYGGEEFTVILPSTDRGTAATVAERLRTSIERALRGDSAVTVSIGCASLSQADFESAEQFFDAADSALYAAKQQGRNCVVVFQEFQKEQEEELGVDALAKERVTG